MRRFNPKGVFFWCAGFAAAGCLAGHNTHGAMAFGALMVAIAIIG